MVGLRCTNFAAQIFPESMEKRYLFCIVGEFWIEAKALCRYFEILYLNWNPDLFKYSDVFHSCWEQARLTLPADSVASYYLLV
jgi:hypothetical protein